MSLNQCFYVTKERSIWKKMKICLKYEQFLEKMSMEDLISVNYRKITNCDPKICYLETSLFKIKISKN